jgi:endonuclease YncB( thermonuclease family)
MHLAPLFILVGGAAVFAGLISLSAAAAQTFSGYARSIDGDSLYVGETEVRLFGIDAPEWSQTCTRDRITVELR